VGYVLIVHYAAELFFPTAKTGDKKFNSHPVTPI
jgi:hypothetical protein